MTKHPTSAHAEERSLRLAVRRLLLRVLLPAVLVATASLALIALVRSESEKLVQAELIVTAERALAAAEAPVKEAAAFLAGLADGPALGCTDLPRLAAEIIASPSLADLLLVDASGASMCATMASGERAALILPHVSARMPTVTIQPDPRPDRTALLIAWASRHGPRLVAELREGLPLLPEPPALSAATPIRVAVGLADGRVWRANKADAALPGDPPTRIRAASMTFPLVAEVTASETIVPRAFALIEMAVATLGGAVGLGFAIAGWRRTAAAVPRPPQGQEPLAYRPVVRINDGQIIGIDLAAGERREQPAMPLPDPAAAIADAAHILRAHPDMKLSMPVEATAGHLATVRRILDGAVEAQGVEAGQLVLRLAAGGLRQMGVAVRLQELRAGGYLIALDSFASDGGLVELVRHRPDFVIIDGDLMAEVDETPEILGIVDAVVAMARRLGMGVIARDIAAEAEIGALRRVGITSGTGPVFGPTANAEAAARLITAERRRPPDPVLAA